MSSKKSNNYKNSKQPFLYVVNSITPEYDLSKYENDLKQYNPIIKFVFKFYPDEIKAFFAFNKEIAKEELFHKLKIQNVDQIIQIKQLPEKDFDSFPEEIIICPIPQCFYKPPLFEDFIKDTLKGNHFEIKNKFDFRIITTSSNYYSAILYQFFNNMILNGCSPKAFYSRSCLLPIVFVTNIPTKFDLEALVDAFQYYLNEKVVTNKRETFIQDNNDYYSTRLTFENFDVAQKAVNMFNFAKLDGVEINANIFFPNISYLKEIKTWKLIIEGIPEDLSSKQLFKVFSDFGPLYKALVKKKPKMPAYGSIQYLNKNDALSVKEKVNLATLNGCTINIFNLTKIKIKNYFPSITEEEILSTFSDFNPFSVKITNIENSRPIVTISFKSESEASEAIEIASKMTSIGMKLYADYEPLNDYVFNEEKSLFLSGLPTDYTQIQLIELCKVYGLLSYARISYNHEKKVMYGFVEYDSQASAENALKKMEGLAIDGDPVKVVPYLHKAKHPRY